MEITLILGILVFLIITFLIFKLIKKVILAVITFFLLIILIIGGIGALVYIDINHLTSQKNINIYFVYGEGKNAQFSLLFPIINKSLDKNDVRDVKINKYDYDNPENIYLFFNQSLMNKYLLNNKNYYLIGTENISYGGFDIKTALTKEQVLKLLNKDNEKEAINDYMNYILAKNIGNSNDSNNQILKTAFASLKPELENQIMESIHAKKLTFQEALFLSVLANVVNYNKNFPLEILSDYKNGNIVIEPDRITFKLVRMLPIDFTVSKLNDLGVLKSN